MKAKQAAEYQKSVEIITKAAALEDVELPRRLIKHRYRASPQPQAIRETETPAIAQRLARENTKAWLDKEFTPGAAAYLRKVGL